MTIAALLAFGALLAAWLTAPAERRHHVRTAADPIQEVTVEPRAA